MIYVALWIDRKFYQLIFAIFILLSKSEEDVNEASKDEEEEEDFVKISRDSDDDVKSSSSASVKESFVDVALETPKKSLLMDESEMVIINLTSVTLCRWSARKTFLVTILSSLPLVNMSFLSVQKKKIGPSVYLICVIWESILLKTIAQIIILLFRVTNIEDLIGQIFYFNSFDWLNFLLLGGRNSANQMRF